MEARHLQVRLTERPRHCVCDNIPYAQGCVSQPRSSRRNWRGQAGVCRPRVAVRRLRRLGIGHGTTYNCAFVALYGRASTWLACGGRYAGVECSGKHSPSHVTPTRWLQPQYTRREYRATRRWNEGRVTDLCCGANTAAVDVQYTRGQAHVFRSAAADFGWRWWSHFLYIITLFRHPIIKIIAHAHCCALSHRTLFLDTLLRGHHGGSYWLLACRVGSAVRVFGVRCGDAAAAPLALRCEPCQWRIHSRPIADHP